MVFAEGIYKILGCFTALDCFQSRGAGHRQTSSTGEPDVTGIVVAFLAGVLFGMLALVLVLLHMHRSAFEIPEEPPLAKVMIDREARRTTVDRPDLERI